MVLINVQVKNDKILCKRCFFLNFEHKKRSRRLIRTVVAMTSTFCGMTLKSTLWKCRRRVMVVGWKHSEHWQLSRSQMYGYDVCSPSFHVTSRRRRVESSSVLVMVTADRCECSPLPLCYGKTFYNTSRYRSCSGHRKLVISVPHRTQGNDIPHLQFVGQGVPPPQVLKDAWKR